MEAQVVLPSYQPRPARAVLFRGGKEVVSRVRGGSLGRIGVEFEVQRE